MRRIVSVAPAIIVLLVIIATIAAAPTAIRSMQVAQTQAKVALAQQRLAEDDVLKRFSNAVANLAEVVEPGVVHIDAYSLRGRRGAMSSGSGWVFDDSGYIITNAHVIRGADRYTVQFSDGYTVTAEFIGLDNPTDVGVLKVDPVSGVFPLARATDARVRQGQRVYAFGSPFGFRFSMSEGIISAIGRNTDGVTGLNGYTNFIQTDAAVNPGNSGGPLVDVEGRVIGMNTAIVSAENPNANVERQGQSAGIGFAIPLDTIESVAGQIIETGIVVKGYLGIGLIDTSAVRRDELPEGFRGTGVFVTNVLEDQPASRAGLQPGDIIIAVNGERIPDMAVLRAKVGSVRPGKTVTVRVVRPKEGGWDEIDLPVEIGAAVVAGNNQLVPVPNDEDPQETIARENADIERVDAALAALSRAGVRDLNLRRGGITFDVRADSPAAEAGITSNDFVVSVNGRTIEGYASFTDAIASAIESRDSAPVEFELRDAEDTVRFVRLQLERP
jgi:serine protease Do